MGRTRSNRKPFPRPTIRLGALSTSDDSSYSPTIEQVWSGEKRPGPMCGTLLLKRFLNASHNDGGKKKVSMVNHATVLVRQSSSVYEAMDGDLVEPPEIEPNSYGIYPHKEKNLITARNVDPSFVVQFDFDQQDQVEMQPLRIAVPNRIIPKLTQKNAKVPHESKQKPENQEPKLIAKNLPVSLASTKASTSFANWSNSLSPVAEEVGSIDTREEFGTFPLTETKTIHSDTCREPKEAMSPPSGTATEKKETIQDMKNLILKQQVALRELTEQNMIFRLRLEESKFLLNASHKSQSLQKSDLKTATERNVILEAEVRYWSGRCKNGKQKGMEGNIPSESVAERILAENSSGLPSHDDDLEDDLVEAKFQLLLNNVSFKDTETDDSEDEDEFTLQAFRTFKQTLMANASFNCTFDEQNEGDEVISPLLDVPHIVTEGEMTDRDDIEKKGCPGEMRDEPDFETSFVSRSSEDEPSSCESDASPHIEIENFQTRLQHIQERRITRRKGKHRSGSNVAQFHLKSQTGNLATL